MRVKKVVKLQIVVHDGIIIMVGLLQCNKYWI